MQLCPLWLPHAAEQSSPCFLHELFWEPQSDLRVGVFDLLVSYLVSNPSLVAGAQHISTAVPGGKP